MSSSCKNCFISQLTRLNKRPARLTQKSPIFCNKKTSHKWLVPHYLCNSGGRIRTSDLRVMEATSSFSTTPESTVSYEFTKAYQFFKEIDMMHMLIMMISNWLHFGYSDIELQEKNLFSTPPYRSSLQFFITLRSFQIEL